MTRRYALADLLEATGLTESGLTRRAGISGTTLKNAREMGFTADAADRYAVRCGLTPHGVWPDYGQIECVECRRMFPPSRKGHDFCTERCYQRRYKREAFRARYQSDPEFRAKRLAAQKRYRDSAKRALAKKQKAWKDENAERLREYRRAYYQANRERLLEKQRAYDARKRQETAA